MLKIKNTFGKIVKNLSVKELKEKFYNVYTIPGCRGQELYKKSCIKGR